MMVLSGLVAQRTFLTNNDDDDIDFDEGFQGNIQYASSVKTKERFQLVHLNELARD